MPFYVPIPHKEQEWPSHPHCLLPSPQPKSDGPVPKHHANPSSEATAPKKPSFSSSGHRINHLSPPYLEPASIIALIRLCCDLSIGVTFPRCFLSSTSIFYSLLCARSWGYSTKFNTALSLKGEGAGYRQEDGMLSSAIHG